MDVGAFGQDHTRVLAAWDDGDLGGGIASTGIRSRVVGVRSAVVALLCLQQVSAVRELMFLDATLSLCAAVGDFIRSRLACGGLLLAREDWNALILALVLLQLGAGTLNVFCLLLLEM